MGSDLTRGDVLLGMSGVSVEAAHDAALFIASRAISATAVDGADPDDEAVQAAIQAAARTWAAEMLEACGLIPTVPVGRTWETTTTRPRAARYGRCPVCRRKRAVRVDGTIGGHLLRGTWPCTGEGAQPLPESEAE